MAKPNDKSSLAKSLPFEHGVGNVFSAENGSVARETAGALCLNKDVAWGISATPSTSVYENVVHRYSVNSAVRLQVADDL